MTKHIELVYGQLTKYNNLSFSICIECGFTSATKAGLNKHIKCEVRSLSVVNIVERHLPRKL